MRLLFTTILLLFVFSPAWSNDSKDGVARIVKKLENRYNIRIYYKELPPVGPDNIKGQQPKGDGEWADLFRYIQVLEDELTNYTPGYIRAIQLDRIAIMKQLTVGKSRENAWVVPERNMMYLDFKGGMYNKKYQRHLFHNNIFKLTYSRYGQAGYVKESSWRKSNPGRFQYTEEADSLYVPSVEPGIEPLTYPVNGILSKYAMENYESDLAEMFTTLMMFRYYRDIANVSQFDPKIRKKVRAMKSFIFKVNKGMKKTYFFELGI